MGQNNYKNNIKHYQKLNGVIELERFMQIKRFTYTFKTNMNCFNKTYQSEVGILD